MHDVTTWLLEGDPSIRWEVLRDLTDAVPDQVAAERARVASSGQGRRLLDLYADGSWAGGACFPSKDWRPPGGPVGDPEGQPWTATLPTLRLLREFGVDPADSRVTAAVDGVRRQCRWEYDGSAFFDGEVEPCINGGTVSIGAYFGQDVDRIVRRLLGEQLEDGGWNCDSPPEVLAPSSLGTPRGPRETENGSTRSSFHTTSCVLEGLLDYERAGGSLDVTGARRRGEEYLLQRKLFRRLRTGEVVDEDWVRFSFPTQWHYDVLRGLDYFRRVGGTPDERLAEAVELVRAKRQDDGTWLLENTHPGLVHFELEEGDGRPSRWNTLRALRVLRWYDAPA